MRELFADIIVDISHEKVDRDFQYGIPEHLQELLEIGTCVQVPFGKGNKLIKGYVVGIGDTCKFDRSQHLDYIKCHEREIIQRDEECKIGERRAVARQGGQTNTP